VGCLVGGSCQDHPVHIPRDGQLSPNPSFTSLRPGAGYLVPRSALLPGRPGSSGPWAALVAARSDPALEMEYAGPLQAVTPRGVVPLRLCVTRRLTCSRCLPFLLASQTALTPSANPLGKPRLHHSHLPLLHGRAMASQAGRVAAPPADPPACDARRRQRAGTVQIPSVRPRNEAERSSDLLIRRQCRACLRPGHSVAGLPGRFSLSCVIFRCRAAL
jgi:hypothetical protein